MNLNGVPSKLMRVIVCGMAIGAAVFAQQAPPAGAAAGAQGRPRGAGRAMNPANLVPPLEESGYTQIFDGKSLNGWDVDPDFWRVEDGAIVGETKADHQPKQNIFAIWRGGKPADFEFKAQYRMTGGNSGIQYRSIERPDVAKWVLQGYQADIDAQQQYTGQIYEERGRGFLALRGMFAYVGDGKKTGMVGKVGENEELKAFIKNDDWNEIHIIARGNTIIQLINGHVMATLVDDDTTKRKMDGVIGLQLHLTSTGMKIEVKNIRLKTF
ncbi:3-keto-disaccharide hydrolase [Paludibaculum fermentans]|nr:DUF1080 domain-containing protein [Paludibaculum fermentans]